MQAILKRLTPKSWRTKAETTRNPGNPAAEVLGDVKARGGDGDRPTPSDEPPNPVNSMSWFYPPLP
ncbi:hypothetical protein EP7_000295 [Isosphaeraceae bacterium EP7]